MGGPKRPHKLYTARFLVGVQKLPKEAFLYDPWLRKAPAHFCAPVRGWLDMNTLPLDRTGEVQFYVPTLDLTPLDFPMGPSEGNWCIETIVANTYGQLLVCMLLVLRWTPRCCNV
ncbi:hypothetical protein AVEN_270192-1 [Araneus ventricosus]|uniref:Uncharacterized protein n=1 Tax=Araneus ventricosus TaxID=182803 RepID=A0A4Y2RA38_ARAVE|nr:hypothetical protein AVEN_270192-1 [Araneus ventricosus]